MKILVCENYDKLSEKAAQIIMSQITLKSNSVLGLATGSTPIGMYRELVKMYKNRSIDFSDVITFNLDEYEKVPVDNTQSYHYFMNENLFNHINVKEENIHIPNGMSNNIEDECKNYDELISEKGPIDIQVLGIGNNAHIGFNEPTIDFPRKTYIVELEESTRTANARFFNSIEEVPKKAITMGIGSIFKSKKIMLLASGKSKAKAIYDTIYGNVTSQVPASILQFHNDVIVILDKDSASLLNSSDYKLI